MVVCKNCNIDIYWSWDGRWIHSEDQNCGNPEPRKYDKATVIGLKETEEDG